jgi:hypothetical protein
LMEKNGGNLSKCLNKFCPVYLITQRCMIIKTREVIILLKTIRRTDVWMINLGQKPDLWWTHGIFFR